MKKVIMFYLSHCPHCRGAREYEAQLLSERPEYSAAEIERIEETERPDIAKKHDYYYVPTYFVGGVKVHEGVNSKADIEKVFKAALE